MKILKTNCNRQRVNLTAMADNEAQYRYSFETKSLKSLTKANARQVKNMDFHLPRYLEMCGTSLNSLSDADIKQFKSYRWGLQVSDCFSY